MLMELLSCYLLSELYNSEVVKLEFCSFVGNTLQAVTCIALCLPFQFILLEPNDMLLYR